MRMHRGGTEEAVPTGQGIGHLVEIIDLQRVLDVVDHPMFGQVFEGPRHAVRGDVVL